MDNSRLIRNYGLEVDEFETSPFEALHMLHIRSCLEKIIQQLTYEEKLKLYTHDMKLIQNAKKMVERIQEIYNFSLSKEPFTEWWWHLDKVVTGEISFSVSIDVQVNAV
ncbi:hypothetical protein CVD28_02785 [Bacillus sp. M6-12]|uniref:hypothetical protein n=1 Tax=Bacillus sp. M6-12 TaxID=2054166 RepID=UPI000C794A2D|nr:hypothetical protein [Bacillus sp. M6-12]PLS19358.1 hypothetical protein CVD28_02785 [Bacillus sp. M6-12]